MGVELGENDTFTRKLRAGQEDSAASISLVLKKIDMGDFGKKVWINTETCDINRDHKCECALAF